MFDFEFIEFAELFNFQSSNHPIYKSLENTLQPVDNTLEKCGDG